MWEQVPASKKHRVYVVVPESQSTSSSIHVDETLTGALGRGEAHGGLGFAGDGLPGF